MSKETDFNLGRETEDQISLMFLNSGYWCRSTRCLGPFQGYDLVVSGFNGVEMSEYKIEIKTDNIGHATGNIVVEYSRNISSGTMSAGIAATTSDFYIWKLQKSGEFLMCRTEDLKRLLRENWNVFERKQNFGRDSASNVILLPLSSFREISFGIEKFFKIN